MNPRGLFVTGTDTDVGKTVVSVALLHLLRSQGHRAVGMKPVASGCSLMAEGWRNDDALALQAASAPMPDYLLVNPVALPEATAPQIAADIAGISITLPALVAAYRTLTALADVVVVEGVGGWLSPLTAQLDQGELVQALGLEVVLVVGLRIGCINHARLSEQAICAGGHRLLGWVVNPVTGNMDFADAYVQALRAALIAPCLGRLPFAPDAAPALMAEHLNLAIQPAGLPAG